MTKNQKIAKETKAIVERIDEYVWYEMDQTLFEGVRAKSGQVITTLIYILVDKGIITLADVSSILGTSNKNGKQID